MRKFSYCNIAAIIAGLCFLLLSAGPVWAQTEAAPNVSERVLVTYFSHTGNTEKVAMELFSQTNGDIYKIEPVEAYAENPREQVAFQREHNIMPELKTPVPDVSGYSLIIIGTPVWGDDVPPPVASFLQQVDLNGVTVACFGTSGSRPGEFMDKLKSLVTGGKVAGGINFGSLYENEAGMAKAVADWLAELKAAMNP